MLVAETGEDATDGVVILLFHLLVVTTTLFSLPAAHKQRHTLEDFVHAAQMLIQKVDVVNLQEPVVALVLLQ